jgi:hypothetical protein
MSQPQTIERVRSRAKALALTEPNRHLVLISIRLLGAMRNKSSASPPGFNFDKCEKSSTVLYVTSKEITLGKSGDNTRNPPQKAAVYGTRYHLRRVHFDIKPAHILLLR